ncbi:MAG: IS3 family transposase, partial [Pseudomonadota bacterium]
MAKLMTSRRDGREASDGICSPRKKRKVPITTDSRHSHAIAPNLLERTFKTAVPDTVWLADISARHCLSDQWRDKAPMQSFFGSPKTELVHNTQFRTRAGAKRALFEYIEIFYNRQRRH